MLNNNLPFQCCRFTYSMHEILQAYKNSVCTEYVQLKVYGTVKFKAEIMYAVVVCPWGYPKFQNYPDIDHPEGMGKVMYDPLNQTGRWNAETTGNTYWRNDDKRSGYRCWECVAFAFYLPGGRQLFLPDIGNHHREI